MAPFIDPEGIVADIKEVEVKVTARVLVMLVNTIFLMVYWSTKAESAVVLEDQRTFHNLKTMSLKLFFLAHLLDRKQLL